MELIHLIWKPPKVVSKNTLDKWLEHRSCQEQFANCPHKPLAGALGERSPTCHLPLRPPGSATGRLGKKCRRDVVSPLHYSHI